MRKLLVAVPVTVICVALAGPVLAKPKSKPAKPAKPSTTSVPATSKPSATATTSIPGTAVLSTRPPVLSGDSSGGPVTSSVAGCTALNHGQFVSQSPKGDRSEAAHSNCGMPANSKRDDHDGSGDHDRDDDRDGPRPTKPSVPVPSKPSVPVGTNVPTSRADGRSGDAPGRSGDAPGQAKGKGK